MIHSKKCFKCKTVKPLDEFYKHKQMADGHLNKCIECTKHDERSRRWENIDKYREYDRKRANHPHRIAARMQYAQTEAGKNAVKKAKKNYAINYPYKKIATTAISNAIRNGKIVKPTSCETCGSKGKIHGHHDDYSKPYEVRWLCVKCHTQWHKHNEPKYPF